MNEPKRYTIAFDYKLDEDLVPDNNGEFIYYVDYQALQSKYTELQGDLNILLLKYEALQKECEHYQKQLTIANVKLIKIRETLEK